MTNTNVEYKIGDVINGTYESRTFPSLKAALARRDELTEALVEEVIANYESDFPFTLDQAVEEVQTHFYVTVVPWKLTKEDEEEIKAWGNYAHADIDEDGDVWVSIHSPERGYWLTDNQIEDYCLWASEV